MNFFKPVISLLAVISLFVFSTAKGAVVEYHLTIAKTPLNISGKTVMGITVNGKIPGPVLRFTEGDVARIYVTNALEEPASIHWYGMLVPNSMDGVPFLTFPPIQPGSTFTYEFPIRQNGTYWYHSHSALQEQSGVYGSIVIEPRGGDSRFGGMAEHVVMLSDWTDENPEEVLRTLRSGNDYYSLRKRTGQSILGAARAGHLNDYFMRELQRMPPMDLADVAYDRFLVNGHPDQQVSAKPGERVRLRIIDGSASTFFHVEFAGGPMAAVKANGDLLVLELMRFADELVAPSTIKVPTEKKPGAREIGMAKTLVDQMTEDWDPARYTDDYRSAMMKLIDQKVKNGGKELPGGKPASKRATNVIDLAAVLQQSLKDATGPKTKPVKKGKARQRAA